MKIRVEYDVPNDGCKCCSYFNQEVSYCTLFNQYVKYNVTKNNYEHCEDCSKAEIEETQYQKLGSQIKVLKTRLNNKYVEVEQLQKQLKKVQVEAQCKILCKLKERLQKYIWQKNIPEVMFNQEVETLIFELINERDFNLRNTLKGE